MLIKEPGIYEMPEPDYHADPCPAPSLSRGIAQMLLRQTPMHAHYAHPRLGGNGGNIWTHATNDGSALHTMILGRGAEIQVIRSVYDMKHKLAGKPVKDFATKAAQEERDEILASGGIPMLAARFPELLRMKTAVMRQIAAHEDGEPFLGPGQSEAVVIWREGDLWLRCMVDRLPDNFRSPPYDFKATNLSVAPGGWERRLQNEYAFQDAFYRRGIAAVRGVKPPPMRFVAAELNAPHGVSIMAPGPALVDLAEVEVERAIRRWQRCLERDEWPGYPSMTAWVDATPWQISAAEEATIREEILETVQ